MPDERNKTCSAQSEGGARPVTQLNELTRELFVERIKPDTFLRGDPTPGAIEEAQRIEERLRRLS